VTSSKEGMFTFSNLEMDMQIPYQYEEHQAAIEKSEDSENSIEENFKVNVFSQDLMNLVISHMNEVCKGTTIYPKKGEIIYINNNKIEKQFIGETLLMRKTLCFLEKTSEKKVKELMQQCIDEMLALKVVFLQILNEIAAFQFRKELGLVKFLLENKYFQFLDEEIVEELEKDNVEEIDRDVREEWMQIGLLNMRKFIRDL
jgi:hypothetical protein